MIVLSKAHISSSFRYHEHLAHEQHLDEWCDIALAWPRYDPQHQHLGALDSQARRQVAHGGCDGQQLWRGDA